MSLFLRQDEGIAKDPCADKLTFENKEQAEGAKVLAKLEHGNDKLSIYLCEKCNLWHLATDQPDAD